MEDIKQSQKSTVKLEQLKRLTEHVEALESRLLVLEKAKEKEDMLSEFLKEQLEDKTSVAEKAEKKIENMRRWFLVVLSVIGLTATLIYRFG